ncbi:hypothetical protein A9174_10510 [Mesorhizobium loti NZP2037]|nr:hypothetical protein A9174_10510 [Mesorhizobium loti NZP2037]
MRRLFGWLAFVLVAGLTGLMLWRLAKFGLADEYMDYLAPIWLVVVVLAVLWTSVLRRLQIR